MPKVNQGEGRAGTPIAIDWECLSNFVGDGAFSARLTLRNVSDKPIAPGWSLYFNTCRKPLPDTVEAGYAIEHLNGDLFGLFAQPNAGAWMPGQAHEIRYLAEFWAINVTDAPLGFYFVSGDGAPALDLGDPRVVPFTRPEQLHRQPGDHVPTDDAEERFRQNSSTRLLPPEQVGRITPRPMFARLGAVACRLTHGAAIVHEPALAGEATFLRKLLAELPQDGGKESARIVLELGPVPGTSHEEAYLLDIEPAAVLVRGATPHGVFNGIQTLAQLLSRATGTAPAGRVLDAPRFGYRGMMLDVARHFASTETVMRLLDCMALYKLNRFHFHLTDDEGWRLAIAALPELTEVGARRGVPADGRPCLPPSFGSGAGVDSSAGTGFYSAADFIEILRYAHARHIEVVPEFNMPGHARAAVVAMRARHDRLRAAGDIEGAERYLLSDPDDASVYESVQLWRDNVICIALPSVDRFIDTVVTAVVALYQAAGVPLRTIHTGGDEVPAGAWLGSPHCRARMQERGWTDVGQLRADFVQRCRTILARHGLAFAGWEETALIHAHDQRLVPDPRFADAGFHVYVWNNAWGSGQEDCAYRLANAGYNVVLANAANLYFDLAYAKHPEEPGYYWPGFVDTRQAFGFCPLEATLMARTDPMGQPLAPQVLSAMERLQPAASARIAGLQGQLWGENARTGARVEYFAAPRLIALAERAWSPDPEWQLIADPHQRADCIERDWNEFANRLGQRELPRLDSQPLAYGYRLPPPGAMLSAGAVHANVALPGLALHYTVDGSEPGPNSARYRVPVVMAAAAGTFKIATFDSRGRSSRTVKLDLESVRHA